MRGSPCCRPTRRCSPARTTRPPWTAPGRRSPSGTAGRRCTPGVTASGRLCTGTSLARPSPNRYGLLSLSVRQEVFWMSARTWLFIALGLFTAFYGVTLVAGAAAARRDGAAEGGVKPTAAGLVVGFITNFFDTLGIGSYATTTTAYRLWGMVAD